MLRVKAFQHLVFKTEDEFEISLKLLVKPDIFLKCVNLLDHSLLLLLCLLMLLTVSFFAFFPIPAQSHADIYTRPSFPLVVRAARGS